MSDFASLAAKQDNVRLSLRNHRELGGCERVNEQGGHTRICNGSFASDSVPPWITKDKPGYAAPGIGTWPYNALTVHLFVRTHTRSPSRAIACL